MISVLLNPRITELLRESAEVQADYVRAHQALYQASVRLSKITQQLRQVIVDGSAELSRDSLECTIEAVAAIHRGDDESAYGWARGSARAATAVTKAVLEVAVTR